MHAAHERITTPHPLSIPPAAIADLLRVETELLERPSKGQGPRTQGREELGRTAIRDNPAVCIKTGPVGRTARLCLGLGAWISALGTLGLPAARAEGMSQQGFGELALRCGPRVAPSTLAAIGETESRLQPLAINDNTTATNAVARSLAEAVDIATRLIGAGHSVDLGLMQINSANLSRMGLTPAQAFDPCMSIAAASRILAEAYEGGDTDAARQAALRRAVSAYNTGNSIGGFENGYVHKVEIAARGYVPAFDDARAGTGLAPGRAQPVSAPSVQVSGADPASPPSWDVWAPSEHTPKGEAERPGDTTGTQAIVATPGLADASEMSPPKLASLPTTQRED